jgi:autotransporter-associated beta strand protein
MPRTLIGIATLGVRNVSSTGKKYCLPRMVDTANKMTVSATIAAALLSATMTRADSGFWASPGRGSLATASNWDSRAGIAGGADSTAYFGLSLEPALSPNATFTLDGPYTVGNLYFTPQTGPGNLTLEPGSGGALTLDATYTAPAITVSLPSLQVTLDTVVAGTAGLTKDGAGTLVMTAANTYSGPTTVNAGTLLVNGRIGAGGVLVRGGTLGGSGTINGPITVQQGGTFTPGPSISALTLQTGSSMQVDVNAATSSSDLVQGLANVTYGGTLTVNNLGGSPVLGQSFQIFSAGAFGGNFNRIMPPPGPGLLWRFDPASGALSVVSAVSSPQIASVAINGANLTLQATNGPPGVTGSILSSTDLSLPIASWTALTAADFDVSGKLAVTCAVDPGTPKKFYLISVPGPH